MKAKRIIFWASIFILVSALYVNAKNNSSQTKVITNMDNQILDTATLGTGCFWCTEAIFEELKGVESVTVGYAGGKEKNPTYMEVAYGNTGFAEVAQILYDPKQISFKELLEVFWKVHNPTTLNQQGADKGPQYRSVIFYHNKEQEEIAKKYKMRLDESGAYDNPIVTEISPYTNFYTAESAHQDYNKDNPNAPYCTFVIKPKLDKFRKAFSDKLKK